MKHLLAYAYLIVNFDRGAKTPLQVLNGVVARSLARSNAERTAVEIVSDIQRDWGISVPIKVIRYALSGLVGQNSVERTLDERKQEERFRSKMPATMRAAMDAADKEARDKYERFKRKITAVLFREQLNNKYRADELIESWLNDSAISFLGSDDGPTKGADRTALEINKVVSKVIGLDTVIDEEAVGDLTDLAVGDVLYKSLKDITEYELENEEPAANSNRRLDVYLDVGIISRAFGYYGVEQKVAVEEMFKMCRDLGFGIKCFQHTVEELREVISAASALMQRGSENFRGPMINYALRTGKTPFDLLQEADRVENHCGDGGILIVERPAHNVALTLNELELEHQVQIDVQQENPRARQRDVDSLTSIFRLRHGEAKVSIDTCEAILITHNRSLQAASHKFFKSHFHSCGETNIVQLCMTDVVFSSRLWVKLPTAVNWKPRSQIIACALSNLVPAPGVREAFLQRLRELVSSNQIDEHAAILLEFSRFTQEILALDYNYGDKFSEEEAKGVISQVIQRVKDGLADARWEGRQEGIREEAKRLEELVAKSGDMDAASQEEIARLKEHIAIQDRDFMVAQRVAYFVAKPVLLLIFLVLCFGTILLALILLEWTHREAALWIAAAITLALSAMAWWGIERTKILNYIVKEVEAWVLARLSRMDDG